ncbi:MAG: hypothetical protein FWD54_00210 [Endomicrobia bacterium]|nr:hypothetical protein [Endomicrobiia bacterium]MCL2798697.1 hypothetical protein [Endomicrobiia bacterium]
MKSIKGQTLVEFLLVLFVLLAATAGVFHLYKKSWKSRYERTQEASNVMPSSVQGGLSKAEGGYVK